MDGLAPVRPGPRCVARATAYAHGLSARYYGLPVYLVGGALRDPDPRDIDVVVPVPDDLFLAMYCDGEGTCERWARGWREADPPAAWRRWARDCAKQSRQMTEFCLRAVDFTTQPASLFAAFGALPRRRLDCGLMGEGEWAVTGGAAAGAFRYARSAVQEEVDRP